MVEIGQKTAELRMRAGISQQRLAEMLGVSRPTITQIENGKRKVSVNELVKLSEIFNLSVENLLCLMRNAHQLSIAIIIHLEYISSYFASV